MSAASRVGAAILGKLRAGYRQALSWRFRADDDKMPQIRAKPARRSSPSIFSRLCCARRSRPAGHDDGGHAATIHRDFAQLRHAIAGTP